MCAPDSSDGASRWRVGELTLLSKCQEELMEADLHAIIRSGQPLTDQHFQSFIYQTLCGLLVRLPLAKGEERLNPI